MVSHSARTFGSSCSSSAYTAAICIAVGKVSLDDWPMLTSSFGPTGCCVPSSPPKKLDGPVRDHLVDVHVGLSARTGLPHVERVVLVQLAGDGLVGRANDGVRLPFGQTAGLVVDQRARLLHVAVGVVDGLGHAVVADGEVLQRTLGLGAPVAVGRHHDLAHAVEFFTFPDSGNANGKILQSRRGIGVQGDLHSRIPPTKGMMVELALESNLRRNRPR